MNNPTARTAMAAYFATQAPWMAVYSTVPGAAAGTELSGGAPAYARKASNWGAAAASAVTAAPATPFDIPAGGVTAGIGFHSASAAGTFWEGVGITSQTFSSQGTLTVTATYTQT